MTPTPWIESVLTAVTASPLTDCVSGVAIRSSPSRGLVRLLPVARQVRVLRLGLGHAGRRAVGLVGDGELAVSPR